MNCRGPKICGTQANNVVSVAGSVCGGDAKKGEFCRTECAQDYEKPSPSVGDTTQYCLDADGSGAGAWGGATQRCIAKPGCPADRLGARAQWSWELSDSSCNRTVAPPVHGVECVAECGEGFHSHDPEAVAATTCTFTL